VKSAADKLLEQIIRLPMPARRSIALALSDVAQEILTAKSPDATRDTELEQLARLEHDMHESTPAERCAAAIARIPTIRSRSAYYRKLELLRSTDG
jgi:hypothetical protein